MAPSKGEIMYILKTEKSFDSAHFLADYEGKCKNIHGHRWRVVVEIQTEQLETDRQLRGMYVDFGVFKKDMAAETELLDHALIIEKGTLRQKTMEALAEEGFRVVEMDFRPTAENFSKYFYYRIKDKGYDVRCATVYETPKNSASYME